MESLRILASLILCSYILMLDAVPTKVLVRNDTNEPQHITAIITRSPWYLPPPLSIFDNSASLSPIYVNAREEVDLIQQALDPRAAPLAIREIELNFRNNQIDLGRSREIRIILLKKGNDTVAKVEPIISAQKRLAARIIMANWWNKIRTSVSSFWNNFFSRNTN